MWYNIGHMMNNNSIEQPINSLDNVLEKLPSSPVVQEQEVPVNVIETRDDTPTVEGNIAETGVKSDKFLIKDSLVETQDLKWDGYGHPLKSDDNTPNTSGDDAARILELKIKGAPVTL